MQALHLQALPGGRHQLRELRVVPDHVGAGLLRGNGYASTSADKCYGPDSHGRCDKLDTYAWIETEDPSDCVATRTTPEPGCCASDTFEATGFEAYRWHSGYAVDCSFHDMQPRRRAAAPRI